MSAFLVVEEHESNRPIGLNVRGTEDARQLHHQRSARPVVIRRFPEASSVHVSPDDVHLPGVQSPDLRAINLIPRSRRNGLGVQRPQCRVRLGAEGAVVWAASGRPRRAPAEPRSAQAIGALRRCRICRGSGAVVAAGAVDAGMKT